MSGIRLRDATPQDAPAMTALIASLPEWFTPDEVETVRAVVGPPAVVAVSTTEEVVGFLAWEQRPDEWEICWLAVATGLHRRGLGRRMLKWMLERARATGISRVRVQTVAATTDYEPYLGTRAFYETCGFRLNSVEPHGWPDGTDKAIYVLAVDASEETQ
jgi:ribosomal protein S18 acetylase RimI-like enzyme